MTLDPAAIRTPNSAKSPRLSRSSLRSPRTSLDVPASSPQSRSLSPTPSPFPITTAPRYATLYLKVRETAVDPGMNIRVNASNWKTFVEKCRNDSLQELRSIVERVMFLRSTFEQDSNVRILGFPIALRVLTHFYSASASSTSSWGPLRLLRIYFPILTP